MPLWVYLIKLQYCTTAVSLPRTSTDSHVTSFMVTPLLGKSVETGVDEGVDEAVDVQHCECLPWLSHWGACHDSKSRWWLQESGKIASKINIILESGI